MSEAEDREGPLPALLFVFTAVTGVVDAVSYLALGRVFVANMTGNVVFLGFAAAGAPDLSVGASLTAIAAFMIGALGGGRFAAASRHRARLLAVAVAVKIAAVAVALAVSLIGTMDDTHRYTLVVLLAAAMGLQNATARRLAVADLTTTVLTLTLTALAADSTLAGGSNPRPLRRLFAALWMLAGAVVGAVLVLNVSVAAALAFTLLLLVGNAIAVFRWWGSTDAWTASA
ncbi:MAG TPA: YoaK family protein [Casimicrobiaceae bacterium]|nr:YoaK family protein [Casimicrobiaceae bacterium]